MAQLVQDLMQNVIKMFSPPDSISVTNNKRNSNLIEWNSVERADSYNFTLMKNCKLIHQNLK